MGLFDSIAPLLADMAEWQTAEAEAQKTGSVPKLTSQQAARCAARASFTADLQSADAPTGAPLSRPTHVVLN